MQKREGRIHSARKGATAVEQGLAREKFSAFCEGLDKHRSCGYNEEKDRGRHAVFRVFYGLFSAAVIFYRFIVIFSMDFMLPR